MNGEQQLTFLFFHPQWLHRNQSSSRTDSMCCRATMSLSTAAPRRQSSACHTTVIRQRSSSGSSAIRKSRHCIRRPTQRSQTTRRHGRQLRSYKFPPRKSATACRCDVWRITNITPHGRSASRHGWTSDVSFCSQFDVFLSTQA